MSFCIAVQSAIFYYVSCAPCYQAKHMHNVRKKAKLDAAEKERYHAANPEIYRQPDPFNTNPYWSEEIMAGPHVELKKPSREASRHCSRQTLASSGKDAPPAAGSSIGVSIVNPPSVTHTENASEASEDVTHNHHKLAPILPPGLRHLAGLEKGPSSVGGSSVDVSLTNTPDARDSAVGINTANPDSSSVYGSSPGITLTRSGTTLTTPERRTRTLSFSTTASTYLSEDWNHKRYQREDEELWGHELAQTGHKLMNAIKHAGASAGRLVQETWAKNARPIDEDEDADSFYFAQRNPPVNDYHPPIVRQRPVHQDAYLWMLQPPPPAKVMEGKVPPIGRSSSLMSTASRTTVKSERLDRGSPTASGHDASGRGYKAAVKPKLSTISGLQDVESPAIN
ncbi:hypothetical protein F5Y18DRAFT_167002 [Xylariaceae sp. FL1019]|nr:hypothetical protein F5Y18DRAFT_167002 [Xylariaceae sp. FL1019]